jgi:hypothetical protein
LRLLIDRGACDAWFIHIGQTTGRDACARLGDAHPDETDGGEGEGDDAQVGGGADQEWTLVAPDITRVPEDDREPDE